MRLFPSQISKWKNPEQALLDFGKALIYKNLFKTMMPKLKSKPKLNISILFLSLQQVLVLRYLKT